MTIILGIDIGLTGAICRLGGGLPPRLEDLPNLPDGAPRPGRGNSEWQPMRLDGRALLHLMRELVPADQSALVLIEDIRPRPNPTRGTSIVTEGSLMRSRGVVESAVEIARFQLQAVVPQTWQKMYGLGGASTDELLALARSLYPDLDSQLKRKKDHNRADAVLIAHYASRRLA
jgi:hypothetical protein